MRYRKAQGKEARLCFGGHILIEHRHGLCADFTLHNPITEPKPLLALRQMDAHQQLHEGVPQKAVGADKGYHRQDFVNGCGNRALAPHVACTAKVNLPGLDGRTTTRRGNQTGQRIRKRVEESFGWIKTVGGAAKQRQSAAAESDRPAADGVDEQAFLPKKHTCIVENNRSHCRVSENQQSFNSPLEVIGG